MQPTTGRPPTLVHEQLLFGTLQALVIATEGGLLPTCHSVIRTQALIAAVRAGISLEFQKLPDEPPAPGCQEFRLNPMIQVFLEARRVRSTLLVTGTVQFDRACVDIAELTPKMARTLLQGRHWSDPRIAFRQLPSPDYNFFQPVSPGIRITESP